MPLENVMRLIKLVQDREGKPFLARIGVLEYVRIPAMVGASMVYVVNAENATGPETIKRASLLSKLAAEKELAEVTQRVEAAAAKPRSLSSRELKREADTILEAPRFRRGFVWSDEDYNDISPSALQTETAQPFIRPPAHLFENSEIQSTLRAMDNYIEVKTPFNVQKFESLLSDHPNQPFIHSVMIGLREGFWPFHEGEWKQLQ